MTLDTFGEALLADLREVVEANAAAGAECMSRRRLAVGGVVAASLIAGTSLAVGLSPVGPGPEPAFALTVRPDGSKVVTVHSVNNLDRLATILQQHGLRLRTSICNAGRGTKTNLDLVSQLIACRDKDIDGATITRQGDGFVVTIPPSAKP